MLLTQLLYCSKAVQEITSDDTQSILTVSRQNNATQNITGFLCNNEQYFIQLLEGNYREINDLYNKIVNDKRHQKATLLMYRAVKTRLFPNWSMGYIEDDQYINNLLRKYVDSEGLLALDLFGKACIRYMESVPQQ
jgi:hypothetical protein